MEYYLPIFPVDCFCRRVYLMSPMNVKFISTLLQICDKTRLKMTKVANDSLSTHNVNALYIIVCDHNLSCISMCPVSLPEF